MMEKETDRNWNDIRKYEEILAKDPDSFCFAPLSDVYRRTGRVDEAIDVAREGCRKHPGYIGGYMALGRACFDKGFLQESREALEKVVESMPDNLLANDILGRVNESIATETAPGQGADDFSIFEAGADLSLLQDEEEIIDLVDIVYEDEGDSAAPVAFDTVSAAEEPVATAVEETDSLWSEQGPLAAVSSIPDVEPEPSEAEPEPAPEIALDEVVPSFNPLNTVTIAELYVSQGFTDRALAIYQELLAADPENMELQARIATLHHPAEEEKEEEPELQPVTGLAFAMEGPAGGIQPLHVVPDDDTVIATLERWLANIRRRR